METKKVYAQQVPPEFQEPHTTIDEMHEMDVIIYGNNAYNKIKNDLFERLPAILDDLSDEWEYLPDNLSDEDMKEWARILQEIAPRGNGDAYTTEQLNEWLTVVKQWATTDDEITVFCDALRLITGSEYKHHEMRGCVQREWQYLIYPATWTRETVRAFETEYFNMGTEWCIKENEDDPGYYIYCVSDDPRAEIAEISNTTRENVVLYAFDGWERIPKYKEVIL